MIKKIQKFLKSLNPKNITAEVHAIEPEESVEKELALSDTERNFLNILREVKTMTVADCMVPRVDIIALSVSTNEEETIKIIAQKPFRFYPVYTKALDDAMGFVSMTDVVKSIYEKTYDLRSLTQEILYVPNSMRLFDLFMHMRVSGIPISLVVDEHGGIDGLITVADITREIIGEGEEDELAENTPHVVKLQDGTLVVDARLHLDEFEEQFGSFLTTEEREEDLDTVGGLVIYLAGRVPDYKEIIQHSSGVEFEILEATPRRVLRVKVRGKAEEV